MEKVKVSLSNVTITGYAGDYILETIKKRKDYYEGDLLRKWLPLLGEPACILDVGANLGNHTVFWGTHLSAKRIVSFEPYTDNYACLCENIKNNNLGHVQPVQIAIGERSGKVAVRSLDKENLGGTTYQYVPDDTVGTVVAPLDALIQALELYDVGFVKIDTEGCEVSVLKGMSRLLEQYMPVLWIEAGKDTILEVLSLLRPKGYVLTDMVGANVLLLPPKMQVDKPLGMDELLVANFSLLERVNLYYRNYETSKRFLSRKDEKIAALSENREKLRLDNEALDKQRDELQGELKAQRQASTQQERVYQAQIRQLQENIREQLRRAEDESRRQNGELTRLRDELTGQRNELAGQVEELNRQTDMLRGQLEKCAKEFGQEEQILTGAKQQILALNGQLQQALRKNKQYEDKLYKIYGTWYGKIALRLYKVLKKVKHMLIKN